MKDCPPIAAVLETCLYATDLAAAEAFYVRTLGLQLFSREPGRHVFFRCGDAMFLVFNAERTRVAAGEVAGVPVPPHGTSGAGHVAFRMSAESLPAWRSRLVDAGVAIEAEIAWPRGGRSIYVRDPAGNSVELASPAIWKLPELAE